MNRFQGSFWGARLLRVAADLAVAVAAFYVAFQIRIHFPLPFTEALLPGDRIQFFLGDWGAVLAAQVVSLYFFGFYDPPQPKARLDAARGLMAAVGLQGLLLAGYWFLTEATFPRSVLVLYLLLCYAGLLAGRWLLDALHRPGHDRLRPAAHLRRRRLAARGGYRRLVHLLSGIGTDEGGGEAPVSRRPASRISDR